MNREIKFRGLSGLDNSWRYFRLSLLIINSIKNEKLEELNPNTITQYIGLKDKNGKEIYEGDIMDLEGHVYLVCPPKPVRGEVKYIKNEFYIDAPGHVYDFNKMNIIGNIYENPELLKENK